MNAMKRAAICGWGVVMLSALQPPSLGQAPSERPPGFTEAQATAGGAAYRQYCASCHGAKLEGEHLAPALTGERFDRTWRGKTADTLMFHVRRMPPKPGAASGGLDDATYTAKIGGRPLDLTFKEFELLKFLAQHPGRVFSRQQLLQEVWGYDYFGGTRTVDVHVRRLRAKLGPEHETLIGTVRNVGYRFVLPAKEKAAADDARAVRDDVEADAS